MTYIPRLVCADCNEEMRPVRNGVVVEMFSDPEKPYYKVECDKYGCPYCGQEVFTGFAKTPLVKHSEPNYKQTHSSVKVILE